jgi:hypothetical protein
MKTLHPTLDELTRIGYGFEAGQEHVEFCVECLETLRRLRLERDGLVRARSVPALRGAVASFLSRVLPNRAPRTTADRSPSP